MDIGGLFVIGLDVLIYSYIFRIYTIILRIAEYQATLHNRKITTQREQ